VLYSSSGEIRSKMRSRSECYYTAQDEVEPHSTTATRLLDIKCNVHDVP